MGYSHYVYCEQCKLPIGLGKHGYELRYEIFRFYHLYHYLSHDVQLYGENEWETKWGFPDEESDTGWSYQPPDSIDFNEIIKIPLWMWNEYEQLWEERYNICQENWSKELDEEINKTGKDIASKYRNYFVKKMNI